MPTLHDEMVPTDINTPTPPDEPRAAPLAVPKPQQSITAATAVQSNSAPTIPTATPIQEAPAPRAAGGNLVLQGAGALPVPAVPLQQNQAAPQALTPVSTLKTA